MECRAHVAVFVKKTMGQSPCFCCVFVGGGSAVLQLLIINIAKFDPVFFSKKTMGQSPCFCRVFCAHWVLSSLMHRIQTFSH